MKTIWATFIFLIGVSNVSAQMEKPLIIKREGTAAFTAAKGAHKVKLTFTTRLFAQSAHRIVRRKNCVVIDGRAPLGTDCGIPEVEIASMRLFFDGKEIVIPKSLYSDCFSPPFFSEYKKRGVMQNYLAIKFSDDLKGVFVFLAAGDGAGVYDAIWIFRKDGHHSRFTNSGGDCRFLDFKCSPDERYQSHGSS